MNQKEIDPFDNSANTPEKENSPRNSITRKVGGFALRVAEVVTLTGATWATQELIFHDSLPIAVNAAIASSVSIAGHYSLNKK